MARFKTRGDLEAKFNELGITTKTIEHQEVFTVEAMMSQPELQNLKGTAAKNLFLKDKKKKLWLCSAVHDRNIKLNELAKMVGAPGGLRLADEEILFDKLGVKQGCVTAFALINDTNNDVNFIVDEDLVNGKHEMIYFHPLSNAASTGITPSDFMKFLDDINHKPIKVKFEDQT
ncbi:prolyl-tRNA synthetase associated domain-containing protein 1 [Lingula anatina]|uniref:PrdX deacylase domain-containing protein 1 n=1 Tax=Lingula anatina TaxID=7574 RepID=A0A1S3IS21_LINAN|nr:prolyl-tRNA synthetase associated domain-containing protein 1 [Lingula anatina]|eukprot:XP_013401010.1 prolyl-tRNA synthetase associated domain-containing protein 1 [Lingula anatina]